MLLPKVTPLLLVLAALPVLRGQTLLHDDFSGGSIDGAKWTTSLPFGQSTVVQAGGVLTTAGRGILQSVSGFTAPFTISGSFTMGNDLEHFAVGWRTDLSVIPDAGLFNTPTGLFLSFSNDGDQISVQGAGYTPVASDHKNYSLTTGQSYSFVILDDGLDFAVSINGVQELTGSTTYSTGNQIVLYSREFSGTSTAVDSITVSAIPEPSGYAIIGGITAALAIFSRRRAKGRLSP